MLLLGACQRDAVSSDTDVRAAIRLSVSDVLSSSAKISVECRQTDVVSCLVTPPQKWEGEAAEYLSMDAVEKWDFISANGRAASLESQLFRNLAAQSRYFVGAVGLDADGKVITAPVFTTFETVSMSVSLSASYAGRSGDGKYAFTASIAPDRSTAEFRYVFGDAHISATAGELRELLLGGGADVKAASEAVDLTLESPSKKVLLAALPYDMDGNPGDVAMLVAAGEMTLVSVDLGGSTELPSLEDNEYVYEGTVDAPASAEFTVTINGEQYGFMPYSGNGGVGSFTGKEGIAYPAVGLDAAQTGTRPLTYSVSKSVGRMQKLSEGGSRFWCATGAAGKLFVRIDLSCGDGIPRYYFRIPEPEGVLLHESFDLFAYSGDYMKPANGCAVALTPDAVDGTEPGEMQAWNMTNAQGANKNEVGYQKTWFDYPTQVSGKVLASEAYIRNRDMDGWKILNCGEKVGAIQLSVSGTDTFGVLETPALSALDGTSDVTLELDIARFSTSSKNKIAVRIGGSGSFLSGEVTVDGKDTRALELSGSEYQFGYEADICPPSKSNGALDKPVSHFKFRIGGATAQTTVIIDSSVGANAKRDNASASRCFVFDLKISR